MVDTTDLRQQFNEVAKQHKLAPATETRIRTLLRNATVITEKQAMILYSIIDSAKKTYMVATPEELAVLSTINIFSTPDAAKKLVAYQDNIGKMFRFGVQFVNKEPSRLVLSLEQSVIQSSMQYITKLGDTYKQQTGQIVADGLKRGLSANDISYNIEKLLENKKWEADRIVRTETMRAAHNGSYAQARRDGMTYYAIDGRAEFCTFCRSISKRGPYPIDEVKYLPPLHPNCACLPVYYRDEAEAQADQDYLNRMIEKQRAILEKEGKVINPDGTSSNVNKKPPEERVKN